MSQFLMLTFGVLGFGTTAFAQQREALDADGDVRTGNMKLFSDPGIVLAPHKADREFTRKYKVQYSIIGCEPKYPRVEMIAYNQRIAAYLDSTAGPDWRSRNRRKLLGL